MFQNKPAIENWGKFFIRPKLESLNEKIVHSFFEYIKFSRIEVYVNDTSGSWLISTLTKKIWETEEFDIDEVVVSISLSS
ncbi:MAG TPA: hypothetical protein VEY06_00395, partial [Flavisolibacter sp.]|nr:hypothetical protein [Flavisolibacter sp.]